MTELRYLLFDLDGTLTDPREGITRCFIHALREMGRVPPEAAACERHIGPPLRDVFRTLLQSTDDTEVEHAVRVYRERFSTVGLFENKLYDGVADVLGQLRARGFKLFVCTSKPEVYAQRILEHFELAEHFHRVYGCGLDGTHADKAELLAHLLATESIEPRAALMIGDRLHDVRAARQNGLRSIGVLYGFGSEAELMDAGADLLCATLHHLADAIDRAAKLV